MTTRYDLAIAGAGPAGSVLGYLAARAGLRVLVTERSHFDGPKPGETAPPELRPLLARIGLSHVLDESTHTEAPAVVSVWGNAQPAERPHILSPFGNGFHLDRRAFDERLAQAAGQTGAEVRLATSIRFERRLRGGGYAVLSRRGERMQARFAVVAIGRGARSTGLPSARRYLDDHVAIVARFGRVGNPAETRTVVEAVPGGWFYMAALPRGRMVAVFMTRAATARGGRDSRRRVWLEAMSHTALIRSSLPDLHLMEALSVHDARASYALCPAGDDWCAVGDARFAPDPLSGRGILWAIEDGVWTAEALSRGAAGLCAAAEERAACQLTEYRAGHALAYGTERRFPDDPFWVHVSRAAALNGEEAVSKAFG